MPLTDEEIKFVNSVPQLSSQEIDDLDLAKIHLEFPNIDIDKFVDEFDISRDQTTKDMFDAIGLNQRITVDRIPIEATAVPPSSTARLTEEEVSNAIIPSVTGAQVSGTLLRSFVKDATFDRVDIAKTNFFDDLDEASKSGRGSIVIAEGLGELAGSLLPIGVTFKLGQVGLKLTKLPKLLPKAIKAISGLKKAVPILEKVAPVIKSGAELGIAGGLYESARQGFTKGEEFNVTSILKEAGLFAGFGVAFQGLNTYNLLKKSTSQSQALKSSVEAVNEQLNLGIAEKPLSWYKEKIADKNFLTLLNQVANRESKHARRTLIKRESEGGLGLKLFEGQAPKYGELPAPIREFVTKDAFKRLTSDQRVNLIRGDFELITGLEGYGLSVSNVKVLNKGVKIPPSPLIAKEEGLNLLARTTSRILRKRPISPKKLIKQAESGIKEYTGTILATGANRALGALHEVTPEFIWRPIYAGQHDYNLADAMLEKVFRGAKKVGIKKGSQSSNLIFKILNEVDGKKIANAKNVDELKNVIPVRLWGKLTEKQISFIQPYQQMLDYLFKIRGLPESRRIAKYAPWIHRDADKRGYKDADAMLESLRKKKIPKKIFDPFAEKRVTKGEDVIEDIVDVMRVYKWYGLKKGFKEPALKSIGNRMKELRGWQLKETEDFLRDWIGQSNQSWPTLTKHLKGLVNRTYAGALFGNVSSSMVNLSQSMNTASELGIINTLEGTARAFSKGGVKEFMEAAVIPELTAAKGEFLRGISPLDFFRQAEFVNRLIAFHTGKIAGEQVGLSGIDAIKFGRDAVRKTQFYQFGGADAPKVVRKITQTPLAPFAQFAQFPINTAKLIAEWSRPENLKSGNLFKFMAMTTALGGPQAILPADGMLYMLLGDDEREFLENWRTRYSISGLMGVNLAPRFGLGIFPFLNTEYGIPLPPVADAGVNMTLTASDVLNRVLTDKLDINFQRDIVQSNFVQRNLPLFAKGGAQVKKLIDVAELPGGRFRFEKGEKFRAKGGEKLTEGETEVSRAKQAFFGESLKEGRLREQRQRLKKEKDLTRRGVREQVDIIVDAIGAVRFDESAEAKNKRTKTIINGLQRLYLLGVNDEPRLSKLLGNEILRRSLARQLNFILTLDKKDRPGAFQEWLKIEADFEKNK